jgi:hypothetical protein
MHSKTYPRLSQFYRIFTKIIGNTTVAIRIHTETAYKLSILIRLSFRLCQGKCYKIFPRFKFHVVREMRVERAYSRQT